jgi:hypothetical protein
MKKSTLFLRLAVLFIALMSLGLFSGCKKCITCTESNTGVTTDYCGSSANVKSFEDELKNEGSALGQDWNCVSQ